MAQHIKELKKYFGTKYWETQSRLHPNFFTRSGHVLVSTIHHFLKDNCFDKASTLTFYSLFALIPLVAIGFGVALAFGFEERFANEVKHQLETQPQIADKIIEFATTAIRNTRGGLIAALGILVLLWTVFRLVGNIAYYFNEIWRVKQSRTFFQQLKSFLPIILLFPLFLVGSSSLIIAISSAALITTKSLLEYIGPFLFAILDFLPYVLVWGLLSFLYFYLPNTKVSWKSALLAGIIAGLLYQFWQWIYITFQVGVAGYGAIYGSFAAIPLFLLWLNYSWLIILFGAELAAQMDRK